MTEEFPAFRKDLLSPEENMQIKTETDSREVEKNQNSETKVSFPCIKCKYVGETFEDLNKHTRRKHVLGDVEKNANGLFQCKSCDYAAKTRDCLLVHVQKHEGQVHRCTKCSYTSECESYLKIHVVRTHSERQFRCDKCEYSTKEKSRLKVHTKYVHDKVRKELRYNCDICDYKTPYSSGLKRHKEIHDNVLIYFDQCLYSSPSERNMKFHKLRTHSDLTFTCDTCPFSCKGKYGLKNHMETVHKKFKIVSIGKHKCEICDKTFCTPSYLKTHMKRHDGFKYYCDLCEYSNSSPYKLKKHKTRLH